MGLTRASCKTLSRQLSANAYRRRNSTAKVCHKPRERLYQKCSLCWEPTLKPGRLVSFPASKRSRAPACFATLAPRKQKSCALRRRRRTIKNSQWLMKCKVWAKMIEARCTNIIRKISKMAPFVQDRATLLLTHSRLKPVRLCLELACNKM